jgi:Tfp pilus assembly protein PilO
MMQNALAQSFKWMLYRLTGRISRVAWLAAGLLALAIFAYGLIVYPHMNRLQTLKQQANLAAQMDKPSSQAENFDGYVKQFPALAQRASKVDDLMALVAQHQLQLDEVSYKTEANNDEPLSRYMLTFSVFASYPEIHQLLNDILTQMPYVAIDSLQLNRENVLDEIVEARIQLIFYFAKTAA